MNKTIASTQLPNLREASLPQPDPSLLAVESYKAFLAERRRLIAERLNTFLGGGQEA